MSKDDIYIQPAYTFIIFLSKISQTGMLRSQYKIANFSKIRQNYLLSLKQKIVLSCIFNYQLLNSWDLYKHTTAGLLRS